MPSDRKSIKMLSRHVVMISLYPHRCDIIFDQSACSSFVGCQALVAGCDRGKQQTTSLCGQLQVQTLL